MRINWGEVFNKLGRRLIKNFQSFHDYIACISIDHPFVPLFCEKPRFYRYDKVEEAFRTLLNRLPNLVILYFLSYGRKKEGGSNNQGVKDFSEWKSMAKNKKDR